MAAIRPAATAAKPNSTLPAAPLDSGTPPEPVAEAVGLGPPVTTGTVLFPPEPELPPVG